MKLKRLTVLVLSALLVACSASQLAMVKRVGAAAPRILSQIATAYGSPYALAIQTFANAVSPETADAVQPASQQGAFQTPPIASAANDQTVTRELGDSVAEERRLTAEVDIVRETLRNGRQVAETVSNGDVLTENDNYKLQVACSVDCYAYVAQLDATGKMDPILPSQFVALRNPLAAGTTYSMPDGNNWFYLDTNKGVEQVYFILSREPRADLEQIFAEISAANENLKQQQAISIEEPMLLERGIGGIREGTRQTVQFPSGEQGEYLSTLLEAVEGELVVTRWFKHQ